MKKHVGRNENQTEYYCAPDRICSAEVNNDF